MTIYNPDGSHTYYMRTARHFCAQSERYTGADSLLTAQQNGWRLFGIAYREDVMLLGGRHTTLYHFKMVRGRQTLIMPIVENPFVLRMLKQHRVNILPIIAAEFTESNEDFAESILA